MYSNITFNFYTTEWSGSSGFYVRGYKYNSNPIHNFNNDTILVAQSVFKSAPASTTYTLTLKKGVQYLFRFYNSTQGEQIVGSGSWTVTER